MESPPITRDFTESNQLDLEGAYSLVYDELRRLAAYYMRQERSNHTLQPTALVHEAYLRLLGQKEIEWQNRAHFFGISARLMR